MKAHPQLRAVCPRAVLSSCNKQLFEKYPDPPPEKFVNDMHTALSSV